MPAGHAAINDVDDSRSRCAVACHRKDRLQRCLYRLGIASGGLCARSLTAETVLAPRRTHCDVTRFYVSKTPRPADYFAYLCDPRPADHIACLGVLHPESHADRVANPYETLRSGSHADRVAALYETLRPGSRVNRIEALYETPRPADLVVATAAEFQRATARSLAAVS